MKILEIGAATGGVTRHVLRTLTRYGEPNQGFRGLPITPVPIYLLPLRLLNQTSQTLQTKSLSRLWILRRILLIKSFQEAYDLAIADNASDLFAFVFLLSAADCTKIFSALTTDRSFMPPKTWISRSEMCASSSRPAVRSPCSS